MYVVGEDAFATVLLRKTPTDGVWSAFWMFVIEDNLVDVSEGGVGIWPLRTANVISTGTSQDTIDVIMHWADYQLGPQLFIAPSNTETMRFLYSDYTEDFPDAIVCGTEIPCRLVTAEKVPGASTMDTPLQFDSGKVLERVSAVCGFLSSKHAEENLQTYLPAESMCSGQLGIDLLVRSLTSRREDCNAFFAQVAPQIQRFGRRGL